jgi:hypothetical protein
MADFSYLDQFLDIEINLTEYLNSVPSTTTYTLTNKQPVITTVKNLFSKYEVIYDYKTNINLLINYKIKEFEFIETVSYSVYGSPEYWWIIALFNNIQDPLVDWPLSQEQMITIATNLFEKERKYNYNTYLDSISTQNETKRDIIVPKSDILKDIIWKYRQALMAGN